VTLLDRYIGGYVASGTAVALLVLLALFTLTELVEDLGAVGRGDYTLLRAAQYMALTTPRRAFELFPMAALVGSLMGLGVLAGNSELVVLRASGVSTARITLAVMKTGALLMLAALAVGEGLAPWSERLAEKGRSTALTQQVGHRTDEGFWIRDGASFINIREVGSEERMGDIYIYEFDAEGRLRGATRAAHARYEEGRWVLEDITQSLINEDRVETRSIARGAWDALLRPDLVDVVSVRPESLSAIGLYRYVAYLRENNLNSARYELALWLKLIAPLTTGVMIFLAIPLVLGRLRAVGVGQRLLAGILGGIAFHVLQETAVHMGVVYGLTPLLSAIAPTAVFFAVGVWLMKRLA